METCVRGFSFMSDSKVELVDLQYIEGGELERAWRTTRRERMKQREQKIWDEFVKEKDVVKGVCKDDPYQFLDQLPETCLKEIMETELQKMTIENAEEEIIAKEVIHHGKGDSSPEDGQHTCVVTFADDVDRDDCDMFHIFDDDQSGPEDEALNEVESPSTVREKPAEEASANQSPDRKFSLEKTSSKSSENVTNVIESSIYCAKVKDLRMKINEELNTLMTTLDRRDILSAEPEQIARMIKRSAEFCTRFNRIYMYQLQRQIHDIKRNNSVSLPFAKHTQFQSQMVRIVSLHQSMLQSFQVFHKSLEQTCMVRESAGALGALLAVVRDATHMCLNVAAPRDFAAAADLYKDETSATCDKVDEFVSEYAIRCEELLNSFESVTIPYTKKEVTKNKIKKRPIAWTKNNGKQETDARLSMYSLDTLRLNLNAKSSTSKDTNHASSTSKMRSNNAPTLKRTIADKNNEIAKNQRKLSVPNELVDLFESAVAERSVQGSIPRSRRPLMRDPHAGRPRAPRPTRETDIRTMVEAVETCASSYISRDSSPHGTRRSKAGTPRRALAAHAPHATHAAHAAHTAHAAHASHAPHVPPMLHITTPRSVLSPTLPSHRRNQPPLSPAKHTPQITPTKPKPRPPSPKALTITKVSLSSIRTDLETIDLSQMTPVCKIQCAMKKDLEGDDKCGDVSKVGSPTRREDEKKKGGKKDSDFEGTQKRPEGSRRGSPRRADSSRRESPRRGDGNKKDLSPRRADSSRNSPKKCRSPARREGDDKRGRSTTIPASKLPTMAPERCEVTRLLKQLCSGDAVGTERVAGAKNAQLLYVNGNSPRQPSTPQLLRILEETIQKKAPKPFYPKPASVRGPERYRLLFNIGERTADTLFQYRTKFVQHMLTSALYANSAVGKPWEMIGSVSEQIIDEVLLGCVKEMELREVLQQLYIKETC